MENQVPQIYPQNIQTEQSQQIPPPSPENPNKSFWKTIAIGMSIVSFGIALAVGGYVLGVSKNSEPKQTACTMEAKLCPDGSSVGRTGPKCEFAPCPTPTPDETATWKTYTNTQYGFSFKYPPDWIETESVGGFVSGISLDGTKLAALGLTPEFKEGIRMYYLFQVNKNQLSPRDWFLQAYPPGEKDPCDGTIIDGDSILNSFDSAILTDTCGAGDPPGPKMFISSGTNIILLEDYSDKETAYKILSTFKFD